MTETLTMTNREAAFNKPQFGAKMPAFSGRSRQGDEDLAHILRDDRYGATPLRASPELAPKNPQSVTDWSDLEAEIAAFSGKPKSEAPAFQTKSVKIDKSYSPAEIYDAPLSEPYEDVVAPRSQRSGVKTIAAILGIAVVGALGIFGYRGLTGGASNEPKIVRANPTPTKETIPPAQQAANKAVMERTPTGPTTVVPRDEKPLTGAQQAEQTTQDENAPRRVRTISISSDGQGGIINRPTVAGMNTLPIAPSVNVGNAQPRPVKTQAVTVSSQVAPTTSNPVVSAVPPVEKPKPTPVAIVKTPVAQANNAPLSLAPKTATPTSAAVSGAFAIQVASAKTESEAKAMFKSMQGKYDSLDGKSASFVKADGDSGAFYRVRIGASSKDKATEFCTQLKSEGGNCFVVKN